MFFNLLFIIIIHFYINTIYKPNEHPQLDKIRIVKPIKIGGERKKLSKKKIKKNNIPDDDDDGNSDEYDEELILCRVLFNSLEIHENLNTSSHKLDDQDHQVKPLKGDEYSNNKHVKVEHYIYSIAKHLSYTYIYIYSTHDPTILL